MTGRFTFTRATGSELAKGEGRLLLPAVDGAEVPGGRLQVHLGPKRIGGQYARIELERGARELINRFQDARQQKNKLRYDLNHETEPAKRAAIEAELATIDPMLKAALDEKSNDRSLADQAKAG